MPFPLASGSHPHGARRPAAPDAEAARTVADEEPAVERDGVQEASEESFPASDAPSWQPLHIGGPKRHRRGGIPPDPDGVLPRP